MYQGEERRSHPRYHAPESVTATATFSMESDQRLQLKDISASGFCFVTETDISSESHFSISLKATGVGDSLLRIDASARIIWHIRDEATSLHVASAKFMDMTETDRETLGELLAFLRPKE